MEELISIIVTVHNEETYLPKCLVSLSIQTYHHIEIILIDDGSTDSSGRICDEFAMKDSRARVIHQKNLGLWAGRNRGQAESRGDYLLFPDGDDYFHKDYVRLLYEAINFKGKQHSLSICGYKDTTGDDIDIFSEKPFFFNEMTQSQLLDKITAPPSSGSAIWGANWNKLYRKKDLPTPFQRNYRYCQDYDSNLRFFFLAKDAVLVDSDLYYWRTHSHQTTKDPQYNQIRNECRTRIFLSALSELKEEFVAYRPHLLTALYTRLVLWKESMVCDTKPACNSQLSIRQAERKTILSFLSCRHINLSTKSHLLFALYFPKSRKIIHSAISRFGLFLL